jgi:hypothetical protein
MMAAAYRIFFSSKKFLTTAYYKDLRRDWKFDFGRTVAS